VKPRILNQMIEDNWTRDRTQERTQDEISLQDQGGDLQPLNLPTTNRKKGTLVVIEVGEPSNQE
jgi:hypothetical protein